MFKKLKRQNKDKEFDWTKNDDKVMLAIEAGDIEKLQIALAKKGTSPTKLDAEGRTPLHLAGQKGQYPCLEVLLQLGANPRASDGQGCTALHCASKGGHLNSMHRLIKAGVPINAQDFNGKTSLHFSAGSGHIEATILLLQCGAAVDIADEYGKTPLMLAALSDHVGVCKDLIDRGASVNSQDHLQKTPLMAACENGNKEVVDLLLKRGARADLRDAQGYNAKYYAEGSRQESLMELLESAPSVATWDVRTDEDEKEEVMPDAVDYIDTFDIANERAESPPPNKNQQNNISADFPSTPSRAISMPALIDPKIDEVKELEEENDFLNEELSKVNIAHKKALERIRSLEGKANQLQEVDALKQRLDAEEQKRLDAEREINEMRNKLSTMKLKKSRNSVEDEEEEDDGDEVNSVESWGDSEDDLFDLPGTNKTPTKPVKLSMGVNSSKHKSEMERLRSEVMELRKENENLRNQQESDEPTPPGTVQRVELEHLRLSSNAKIADLEEELASLKEELTESHDQSHLIPYDEYQELKEASEAERGALTQENLVLKDEIANVCQRLAVMQDQKERLQIQVNEQQELQLRPVSSSSADFRYNELVQEKLEMEEIINKHSEVLAEQADDLETSKKDTEILRSEKEALEARVKVLEGQGSNDGKSSEEYVALKSENERLQATIGKQSKAIAQQTDRMRKDKLKFGELSAERDRLVRELEDVGKANGDGDSEERRLLEKENRKLMEQVGRLERQMEDWEEERRRLEELTAENWRLQDAVRKTEDEILVKNSQLSKLHAAKNANGDPQRLEEENKKLSSRNRELEMELSSRQEKEVEYLDLVSENVALKARLGEMEETEDRMPNGGMDRTKLSEVIAENQRLKEALERATGMRNGGLVNGIGDGGGGGKATASLKEVTRLKQQMAEMDARHRETVNIYRAHLLSAVQDDISPEVKEALQQIVKLRQVSQVT